MHLDRIMTVMLVEFVVARGTMVVHLDKALYGCVEAAALWYHEKLLANGFIVALLRL